MALLVKENVHISIFKVVNHFIYIIDSDVKKNMNLMMKRITIPWFDRIASVEFGSDCQMLGICFYEGLWQKLLFSCS